MWMPCTAGIGRGQKKSPAIMAFMQISRFVTRLCNAQLLDGISGLQRGVAATDEDKQRVDALAKALEAVNPNRKALASPLINGKWELL